MRIEWVNICETSRTCSKLYINYLLLLMTLGWRLNYLEASVLQKCKPIILMLSSGGVDALVQICDLKNKT